MDRAAIDLLLTQAARSNREDDTEVLFKALSGQEVFFWINTETQTDHISGKETAKPVSAPLLRLPNGEHALVLYTSKEDPQLQKPIGGVAFERATRIMLNMKAADGLLVVDDKGDTIAVSRGNAPNILRLLGLALIYQPVCSATLRQMRLTK